MFQRQILRSVDGRSRSKLDKVVRMSPGVTHPHPMIRVENINSIKDGVSDRPLYDDANSFDSINSEELALAKAGLSGNPDIATPSRTPSPDETRADIVRAAQHREAFEWAEQDAKERVARGDKNAPYIFGGFPTWVNWDLFTRLENAERQETGQAPLPRMTRATRPEMLQDIHDEWYATRDKWADRFWDPRWATFMRTTGNPIQKELADQRKTDMGRALEAARVYQRESSELMLAKREFSRGYMWDGGYMHQDWQLVKEKSWRWAVEHENDERRAAGRAPLPRYDPGMSHDDWHDVRDVWATTASKWAEKRKDPSWVKRDQREGMTPERRLQLEQQFLKSRQQHKVIHKTSGHHSLEAPRPDGLGKIRHDSTIEELTQRQEVYMYAQGGTPKVSEADLVDRKLERPVHLDGLLQPLTMAHSRPPVVSSGGVSIRRGEGSVQHGSSGAGHGGPSHDGWGDRALDDDTSTFNSASSDEMPLVKPFLRTPHRLPPRPPSDDDASTVESTNSEELPPVNPSVRPRSRSQGSIIVHAPSIRPPSVPSDDDTSSYNDTSSEDLPVNSYLRNPYGPPRPPPAGPLPDWMLQKTSDPPSSSTQSLPNRNLTMSSVSKTKKPGILKGILKHTVSTQRKDNDNDNQNVPDGANTQRRNGRSTQDSFAGIISRGHFHSEVSLIDNPWAEIHRTAHRAVVQFIRFDRNHPFSMTSPHALDYEGKLYPSAIHLWHAMRFLRRPAGRGRGRTEEVWHPEFAEGIRQASEPELYADQCAHAGAIGKDRSIMQPLQRPDWEDIKMDKIDEVLALKFTQHPSEFKCCCICSFADSLFF
jgi:predicted NAD-dependent protein-ADP-ribosyltransferase YbiA (DUF1768 family)